MRETVVTVFENRQDGSVRDIEVPLDISAQELALALNEAFDLGMDTEDIFGCYLAAENPIAFLQGNRTLGEYGIRNGSHIIYHRSER